MVRSEIERERESAYARIHTSNTHTQLAACYNVYFWYLSTLLCVRVYQEPMTNVCTQMYTYSVHVYICRPVEWRKLNEKTQHNNNSKAAVTATAVAAAAAASWTTNKIDDGRCFNLSIRTILDQGPHIHISLLARGLFLLDLHKLRYLQACKKHLCYASNGKME